jgi:hypothetical protein
MTVLLLDAAGRRRSPVTMPGYHAGRPPGNKGMRYPADPPTVDEIVAVMRQTGDDRHGFRLRGMIVVLWRAGLRLQEDSRSQSTTSTSGAGRCWSAAARAEGGARWAWTSGAGSSCVPGSLRAPSCPWARCSASSTGAPAAGPGRPPLCAASSAGSRLGRASGVGSRRTSSATRTRSSSPREGVPLNIIQRQLGHANLGTTSIYLQGIDPEEIITAVRTRRAPMMSASAGLKL